MGPCEAHLTTYGKVKELAIGSFGEWSDDVHIVIKACAASIAHFTWQESGYSDEEDACAILTTYCFKKLAILSLREVAVLLRNRVDQIGLDTFDLYIVKYILCIFSYFQIYYLNLNYLLCFLSFVCCVRYKLNYK